MLLAASSLFAQVAVVPTGGRNVRSVAVAELDLKAPGKEIVGGCYDGRVAAFTATGRHLWDAATGGFVFHLAAADLDGDARDEVIAGSADGWVYVFGAAGRLRWKRELKVPVTQVAAAALEKGRPPVVVAGGAAGALFVFSASGEPLAKKACDYVSLIRAADFDGDGADEVLFATTRTSPRNRVKPYVLRLLDGPGLREVWTADRVSNPFEFRYLHGTPVDMDGDGSFEFVERQGIARAGGALEWVTRLETAAFPPESFDFHYRRMLVTGGDLAAAPGVEAVTVFGPDIALYDAKGKVLGLVRAPHGFSDIAYLPGEPRGALVLASAPNGDDSIYLVHFNAGWEKALASLGRQGISARIAASIAELSRQVRDWKGTPARGQGRPIPVEVRGFNVTRPEELKNIDQAIAEVRFFEREFPYPRLQFATALWITDDEKLMRPDGAPWSRQQGLGYALSRAQITEFARRLERERAHFWVQIGHGNDPYLSLKTIEAILEAAPSMCLGFVSAEDEGPEEAPYYLEHYIRPVMEACLRSGGRRMILREKNAWWASVAAMPQVRRTLFDGRYRAVLLPSVEDSNSRSPDVNLAARVGLWLDGQVDGWSSRIVSDVFSFNRATSYEYPMAGHPHLRYLTAHAALGASAFMIEVGQVDHGHKFTRVGAEGVAPFLHMLGKGIIAPPAREQWASLSPVVLSVLNPSARYLASAANGHQLSTFKEADLEPVALSRLDCFFGMAPTPDSDASAYLWGRRRQFGNFIPRTALGFVAVLPGTQASGQRWARSWTTDGDALVREGKAMLIDEARSALGADLREGAAKFPFAVRGDVFQQTVAESPEQYLLYLVDPGFVDPAGRDVTVALQTAGDWIILDRLSGRTLGRLAQPLKVTVPAGTMRLLEIRKRRK